MSTPKPGQIRCPTCLRSTPPAAFCTQCGSPIPPSALTRPRGLDRNELEERVRRRPGEGFRRGTGGEEAGRPGYVPYQPEPEDALAQRRRDEAARRVDKLPAEPDPEGSRPAGPAAAWVAPSQRAEWPAHDREPEATPPPPAFPYGEPTHAERGYDEPEADYSPDAYDDTPYGRPEDAYAYPYQADDRRRGGGGGGGALPIIGFVVLGVLALGVGAVLAGLLSGEPPAAEASPSATVEASGEPSEEASGEPSADASATAGEATPQPTDGPIAFPDGGLLTIQPCDTNAYRQEAVGRPEEAACEVDGSTVDDGSVTAVVVFNGVSGSDTLTVQLRSNGETLNELEQVLSSVVNCGDDCNGLIFGASYQALDPGEYQLVLERNGEFADSATFAVEG